jgi:ABC-type transporter Mla subunit MlaD
MFNFTDTEVGLMMRSDREHAATVAYAQGIVDSKNASIDALRAALRNALSELEDERALRLAAELRLEKLNRLLDTPLH